MPGTGRSVRCGREDPRVTPEARSERTAQLLIARLDALTHVADLLPRGDAERLVELATVATMRAVALDLIEADRAEAIWQSAKWWHEYHNRDVQPVAPAPTDSQPAAQQDMALVGFWHAPHELISE